MNGAFYALAYDAETVFCIIYNIQFTDITPYFHNSSFCFESSRLALAVTSYVLIEK